MSRRWRTGPCVALVVMILASCSDDPRTRTAPADDGPVPTTVGPTVTQPTDPGAFAPDSAAAAGLHDATAYGRGVTILDLDGDGWDDVFVADTDTRNRGSEFGVSRAFHNEGGTFRPWDLGLSTDDMFGTSGGIFGDYDNDGHPDLLIVNGNNTAQSRLALYQNRLATEGRFVDVTATSGVPDDVQSWWGGVWVDVNVDGWLDVIVTGSRTALLVNDGRGHFTDETAARGLGPWLTDPVHKNPIVLDLDNDGWPDLASGGGSPAALFRNDGNGHFEDVAETALPQADLPHTWWLAGFNGGAQDYNQDGWDDLYLGRFWYQDYLLLNDGDGTFTAHSTDVGLRTKVYDESVPFFGGQTSGERSSAPTVPTTWQWVGDYKTGELESENTMGSQFGDLDDDGSPDVFIGTGDPSSANLDIVFCGDAPGDGTVTFERCHPELTADQGPTRGHGIAFGDVDRDGATDVITNPGGWPAYDAERGVDTRESIHLYLGARPAERAGRVRVRSHGRDALGASLTFDTSPPRYAAVRSTQGFQSQSSNWIRVPPGTETVTVRWPGGAVSEHPVALDADGRMVIDEPTR